MKNTYIKKEGFSMLKKINFIGVFKISYNYFKLGILFIAYTYLFYQLWSYISTDKLKFNFRLENIFFLFPVICLMFINWSVEALKWKLIVERIEKLTFKKSLKAIFSGVMFGSFTPNRLGEPAGRVLFLQRKSRFSAVFATFIGSFSQLLTTLILGSIAFSVLIFRFGGENIFQENYTSIIAITGCFLAFVSSFLYLKLHLIASFFFKKIKNKHSEKILNIYKKYNTQDLFKILVISILRYFVFLIQFYLLLQFCDVNIGFIQSAISISCVYFAGVFIPSVSLAEIGVRGSLSLFFVGFFSQEIVGIVSASSLLWLINLIFPAIIGSVFFYCKK